VNPDPERAEQDHHATDRDDDRHREREEDAALETPPDDPPAPHVLGPLVPVMMMAVVVAFPRRGHDYSFEST
jgi:hypothetical protein